MLKETHTNGLKTMKDSMEKMKKNSALLSEKQADITGFDTKYSPRQCCSG